jgi:hypothetical protein
LSRSTRLAILWAIVGTGFVALCFVPRIPLGPDYHHFVDRRPIGGIPNCFDVLSNLPFLIVGMWGLVFLPGKSAARGFRERRERIPYLVFFAGVAITGFGSGIYHLSPNNTRLIGDLLPMTFSFVALVAATYMERVSTRGGLALLVPMMALGAASVFYWYTGELRGSGDLRFYLFVQFFSPVVIATIMALFPPVYTRSGDLFVGFGFYLVAKLFELSDRFIFGLGGIISGHTLKHLTAGLTCYWILRMLKLRTPLPVAATNRQTPGRFNSNVDRTTISVPSM